MAGKFPGSDHLIVPGDCQIIVRCGVFSDRSPGPGAAGRAGRVRVTVDLEPRPPSLRLAPESVAGYIA
eukprot:363556-Hanusia_phi.AAC.2